ncbi:MAG: hypothetical protein AAB903_03920 [Patescibacteria group bacterium]
MPRFLRQAALLGWAFMSYGEGGSMAPDVTTHSPSYIDQETCDRAAGWLREQIKTAGRETAVSICYQTDGPPEQPGNQLQAARP